MDYTMKKVWLSQTLEVHFSDGTSLIMSKGPHYLPHDIANHWFVQRHTVRSLTIIPLSEEQESFIAPPFKPQKQKHKKQGNC